MKRTDLSYDSNTSTVLGPDICQDYYKVLFDYVDEGFCIIEVIFDDRGKPVDYRFLLVNASFERQTGLEAAAGRLMREMAPGHEQHWFDIYGRVAVTGEPVRFENEAAALNRWYTVYAFRVGAPEKHHVAILFYDITEKRRTEEALRLSVEQLKESNTRLSEANRTLDEGNRRLEDFVHIVSHDLKEPVRGLNSYCSLLLADSGASLDAQGQRDLQKIKKMSARIGEMISDLLRYCAAGVEGTAVEALDLRDVVSAILDLVQPQVKNEHVSFTTSLPAAKVRCHKAHIAETFRNLIVNAIKYNKNDPKKIDIGFVTGHARNPGGYVFFVKDNGIGIPADKREAVFKMFRRLHARDAYGGGTGAGLAIVKKMIEQDKGEIWIEPNESGGSTVYFYFGCA
jgi:signal transduction histidine kinase